jgi:hypothetical protein
MYCGELHLMELEMVWATQRGDSQGAENFRNKIDEWKRHSAELQPYDAQTLDAIKESKRMLMSDPEALQSLLLAFGRPALLPWFGVDRQAEIARIAGRCLELLSLDRSPTQATNDWSWIDQPIRENALCLVFLEMSTAGLRETSWWRVWVRIWLGTVRYRSADSEDRCWNLVWRIAPEERLDDVDEWIVQQSGRSLEDLDALTNQIVGYPRGPSEPPLPLVSLAAALRSLRQAGGG